MRIRYTPQAARNLAAIADYLVRRSPQGAAHVRAGIMSTVQRVAQLPESGRAQKSPGIRKVVVSRYGYIIYYRVDESHGAVDIVTIRHPARRRLHQDR